MKNISIKEKAERALKISRDADILVFDVETSGVDWRKNFPIGYVLSDGEESLYIPIRAGGGGNLPGVPVPKTSTDPITVHPFEKDLAKIIKQRTAPIEGHHIKFDAHMAANAGILLGRNLICTQNNEVLLDEYARQFGLDACAARHKVQAKKGDELYKRLAEVFGGPADRKSMANFWQLSGNDQLAVEYAEGDGITTYQLGRSQYKKLQSDGLDVVWRLECDLIWTLFRMERKGVRVDVEYLHSLKQKMEDQVETARKKLPSTFNVRSPIDMKTYVTSLGHTDWPKTDLGNPSFTEHWLRTFPEGKYIVTIRKYTNMLNSFIGPLITEHVYQGRVHAIFNQLRSDDSGTPARLSCSHPNLQQIPKRDKDLAPLFRRAFIPDDNMDFDEADWSQCEPRLYAHYANEPALLEGYNKTPFEDAHATVAKLLNVERDPTAKRMNMGIFTGMYPKTFAEHMGWPIDLATEKWNLWHSMFPKVRQFQDQAKQVLLERGYVKTILGRRLRLEHPRFAYRAVSKIIQGGNADIMKYKMVEIDKLLEIDGDRAHLLASIHDSLAWQTPRNAYGKSIRKEILKRLVNVQVAPFNLRVPFAVDHKCGKSWADATFGLKEGE